MALKITSAAVLIWTAQLVAAQEKACSSFCSSLGMVQSNPGGSCDDIYQINKGSREMSGYYWINTTTGVHQVYCDMELNCGGHKGGWMRIADLDTSRGDDCPTGWSKLTTPTDPSHPTLDVCRSTSDDPGCYSTIFTVNGTSYHKVCGKVRGYQGLTTDAFGGPRNTGKDINNPYVDGVSITLGNPRKHVWTYASGISEGEDRGTSNCPCSHTPGAPAHAFIRDHYYCESGFEATKQVALFYTDDTLWDGSGCIHAANNCCTNIDMPWFFRKFPIAQKDDIEVRICVDQAFSDESVVVDQLQLFVK